VSLFAVPNEVDRSSLRAVPREAGPVLASSDTELTTAVHRLADAAGVDLVEADVDELVRHWAQPRLVIVSPQVGSDLVARNVTRRPGVVVVSGEGDDASPWRVAVELGADHVAQLPEAEPWLTDRLAQGDVAVRAPVVAVIGGCGGAGASTLAAALAVASARGGRRPLLIDLDPIGAGLDVLLGGDDALGAHWEDLGDARGRVDGAALRSVLPNLASVPVITWRRDQPITSSPSTPVFASVLEAGRRSSDVVVIDLPRRLPLDVEVLSRLQQLIVVTPARVRAAVAAGRLVRNLAVPIDRVRLVVRGPAPAGLDGKDVSAAAGVERWLWLDPEPRREEQEEHGVPPATGGRGPLAQCCRALLDAMDTDAALT
jgi:secretion/DNA translocation related CpaE-like protein